MRRIDAETSLTRYSFMEVVNFFMLFFLLTPDSRAARNFMLQRHVFSLFGDPDPCLLSRTTRSVNCNARPGLFEVSTLDFLQLATRKSQGRCYATFLLRC